MPICIFCNLCFESRDEIKRNFFITSCSHVFCETCVNREKNFCKICSKNCKVLQVNNQMPSEVRIYFEDESCFQMAANFQKAHRFHENQAKLYVTETQKFNSYYQQKKVTAMEQQHLKKKIKEAAKIEMEIQQRLKQAYNNKTITPDLFEMSSRRQNGSNAGSSIASSSSRPSEVSMRSEMTNQSNLRVNPSASSIFAPSPKPKVNSVESFKMLSSPSRSNVSQASTMMSINSSVSRPKSNLTSQMVNMMYQSARSSPSPVTQKRPVFSKTPTGLLEQTLRQMQKESQQQYNEEIRNKRRKHF